MAFQPRSIAQFSEAAVTVDLDKCIAHKGCTVCIDVCPMDILEIDPQTGKAFMKRPRPSLATSSTRISWKHRKGL